MKANANIIVKGRATHRRTEADYMAALLDVVTVEAWRDIVAATVDAAKNGDAQARAWLAQYLVGKPAGTAPTPINVVVQQLSGVDPLVERLAAPAIERERWGQVYGGDEDHEREERLQAVAAAELGRVLPKPG